MRAMQGLSPAAFDFLAAVSPQCFEKLVAEARRTRPLRSQLAGQGALLGPSAADSGDDEVLCGTQPFDESQILSQSSTADTLPYIMSQSLSQRLSEDFNANENSADEYSQSLSPSPPRNVVTPSAEESSPELPQIAESPPALHPNADAGATLTSAAAAAGPRGPFARAHEFARAAQAEVDEQTNRRPNLSQFLNTVSAAPCRRSLKRKDVSGR